MDHKQLLDNDVEGIKWVKYDKKQWKDALIDNAKEIVTKWWTKETRVSLNVKDVVCWLVSTKTCEKQIVHFLQKS